jgi:hypothetical protein
MNKELTNVLENALTEAYCDGIAQHRSMAAHSISNLLSNPEVNTKEETLALLAEALDLN